MLKTVIYAILAALSFIYSFIVLRAKSGTYSFAIWIGATLFFAFLAFMVWHDRWASIPSICHKVFNGLVIVALVVFAITQGCILSQFFAKGEPNSDYIVVLGAQMRDWGPSIIFKHRLDAAIEYWNENPNTTIIVTGGQGSNESISEGEGGKQYLVEHGISEDCILAETTSVNTTENIVNAFALIPEAEQSTLHIGIVTNNFHVFRGTMLAKKHTEADISGVAAKTNWLYLPNNMVRESFGIIKDCLK